MIFAGKVWSDVAHMYILSVIKIHVHMAARPALPVRKRQLAE